MRTLIEKRKIVAIVLGMFATVITTSVLVSYLASNAQALTIPTTNPFYYSGLLTDKIGALVIALRIPTSNHTCC